VALAELGDGSEVARDHDALVVAEPEGQLVHLLDQRRVDLLGALDHGAAGGQQAAALVGRMRVLGEVAGVVEAMDQRGRAAGAEAEKAAELAGRQLPVLGQVPERGGFGAGHPQEPGGVCAMAFARHRLAMQQLAQVFGGDGHDVEPPSALVWTRASRAGEGAGEQLAPGR
jgi:hypothetical protein